MVLVFRCRESKFPSSENKWIPSYLLSVNRMLRGVSLLLSSEHIWVVYLLSRQSHYHRNTRKNGKFRETPSLCATWLVQWRKRWKKASRAIYPGSDGGPSSVQDRLDLLVHEGRAVPHPHQNLCEVPLRLERQQTQGELKVPQPHHRTSGV